MDFWLFDLGSQTPEKFEVLEDGDGSEVANELH